MRKFLNIFILMFVFVGFFGLTSADAWFWNKEKKAEKEYQRSNKEADKGFKELDNETDKLNNEKNNAPAKNGNNHSGLMNMEPAYPASNDVDPETVNAHGITGATSNAENVIEKQNPRADVDKKRPVICGNDYPLINGLPNWVVSPSEDGYPVTAVGLGIYGSGGISGQKRAARIQAEGEISKMLNVKIDNELNLNKSVHVSASEEKVESDMTTNSRQRASEVLNYIEELKCWVDPNNSDYYVLVGVPYDKVQSLQ